MSRDQIEGIRQHLRRAWFPFFSRFGQLTPVQIEVIPKILNNSNVVVAAPTASGKTEAVVAPVAERFVVEKWQNLAILYVVPTKALAEDTFFRIKDPLNEMNIKVQIRHGDKKYLSSSLPNFLITTPESLDSLLCRKGGIFRHLRAVIIDEIHF
ncbi:MAG: DEAD/DEAH box helicase, partial [Candidatus Methanomethylicaceae archaeon]